MAFTSPHLRQSPAARQPPASRRALFFIAMLLAGLDLSGCQGISVNSAELRVIDASPDAGLVDSYQNNAALAYNLGFGTMTTYIPMSPGVYNLAANKVGTHQALVTSNETLAPGKQYTQIVAGGLANLEQTVLLDQSTPAPTGEIALRILNETTHIGAVDVYLVPRASASSKSMSTSPLAVNLGVNGNTGYIAFPEGAYAIDVVPAGTPLTSSTVTLLSGPQVDYASGAVRTIVLIDQQPITPQHTTTIGVQTILADDADAQ